MSRARDLAAFVSNADGDIKFDTDTLFIDSSANRVGIGTDTPSESLHITNADDAVVLLESTGSDATDDANIQLKTTNGTFTIQNDRSIGTSGALTVAGNTSNNIVVDHNAGNVGIGVTPYSHSGLGTLSTVNNLSLIGNGTSGAYVGYNVYYNGDWKYAESSAVSLLSFQNDGTLTLRQGASGTKDNAVSLSERMRIDSSGNLLVGRTSQIAGGKVCIDYTNGVTAGMGIKDTKTTGTGVPIQIVNGSGTIVGSISQNQSSTSFNTTSDYRLKENVTDVTDGITRVKQLAPKRFNFIADADTTVDGFLAHEAQTVVPEAVTGTHNEVDDNDNPVYQGIDQSKLVPLLTAALQEAITKIETLETENTAIKARLDALEAG